MDAELAVVRRTIFVALPLILALAGVGGYLLATRSLRPLGWMAEQAQRITGSNLETRLQIDNAAEELSVLVFRSTNCSRGSISLSTRCAASLRMHRTNCARPFR